MQPYLIKNALIVNEGTSTPGDVLIKDGRIEKVANSISTNLNVEEIAAEGKLLIPGVIDDQVHFREPGFTHKAEIYTEAKAAVAGGVTSFMEMPNTTPQATTQKLLEEKYARAAECSLANYSFYMGATNENLKEVLKTDFTKVCGTKVFMGSSTGNMLVDDSKTLEEIFLKVPSLIATHCEDEETVRRNSENFKKKYGEDVPIEFHPEIRNVDACYKSSSLALNLARKFGSRLHVLHISTAKELELFDEVPLSPNKKITAEVCVHHLWFDSRDYAQHGTHIKCNPAIKSREHKEALRNALSSKKLDVVASDHAPHTLAEKANPYFKTPSGLPLIQHSLNMMLTLHFEGIISLEMLVEKMCHSPAKLFGVKERGYVREGYFADLVLVDLQNPWRVSKENIYYKCGWSPLEGMGFETKITHTFVNGHLAFVDGKFDESFRGNRLLFEKLN